MTARGTGPARVREPSQWNVPNLLTVVRFVLVPVYGALLLHEDGQDPWYRFIAWVVFAVAAITDGVDGRIARSRGLVTNFGKIADPIADKALTGMAFIGLSMIGLVWWWVTIVILAREFGITLMRFVVIRHGVMPAGRGGKLKTMLQTFSLGLLTLPLWVVPGSSVWIMGAYVILGAALLVTVVTGFDYLVKAYHVRQNSELTRRRRESAATRRAGR